MTAIPDIISHVEKLMGHQLNRDEGVHHGDAEREVTGATVSWMASPGAIEAAGESAHELLIAHESVFFPYDVVNLPDAPADWKSWATNRQRIELLDRYGLTCVRIHGSADQICIYDTFAELLGLGEPVAGDGLARIYEIPECSLDELVERVKDRMGMPRLRLADADSGERMVRRVGLPWGGLGLFVNVHYQQRLVALGCDVFIAGESDSYGFRFACEAGVPMIETSHEGSENPGLRRFTEIMAEAFPEVQFRFYDDKRVWRIV